MMSMGASAVIASDVGSVRRPVVVLQSISDVVDRLMTTHLATSEIPFLGGGCCSTASIPSQLRRVCPLSLKSKVDWHSKSFTNLHGTGNIDIRCSVSSVTTLEEAKVARGCLYMQMPVQQVCPFLSGVRSFNTVLITYITCSTGPLPSEDSKKSRRMGTTPQWSSWRSGTRRVCCLLCILATRRWRE